MKRLKFIILVSTSTLTSLSAAQERIPEKLTLAACIQLAVKNNPDVQRSTIQSQGAYINLLQSKENILPTLNATIIHGINEGRNIDPYTNTYLNQQVGFANHELAASWLLFDGMGIQNLIRQNTVAFETSKAKEQQVKDNVSLSVMLVYLQVLTNRDLLTLSYNQVEVTKNQLNRLETLNKTGEINPATYYDLKGQLMNDELLVATNKNILENSKIALAQLLNIPYDQHMELQAVETSLLQTDEVNSAEALYAKAEQHLAMIRTTDLQVKVAAMQVKYARSGYFPSLYLKGALLSNYSSKALDVQDNPVGYMDQFKNNLGKSVNVSLVVPLFNNLRTRNAVSLAKLTQQEMQLTADATHKQVQKLTAQAYLNMLTAKEKWEVLTVQVQAFEESFKSAEVRFNLGVIHTTDYLISKNNLEKSKINKIISGYDFILRKKIVDFYGGRGLE